MQALGRYDTELQMFVEPIREPNRDHLEYLRWLHDHGRFWDDARELHAVYPLPRDDN